MLKFTLVFILFVSQVTRYLGWFNSYRKDYHETVLTLSLSLSQIVRNKLSIQFIYLQSHDVIAVYAFTGHVMHEEIDRIKNQFMLHS